MSDMGAHLSRQILEEVRDRMSRKNSSSLEDLFAILKSILIEKLSNYERSFEIDTQLPHVIMMVGVNGVGKTTSIGKLASYYRSQGHKPVLACGDLFELPLLSS